MYQRLFVSVNPFHVEHVRESSILGAEDRRPSHFHIRMRKSKNPPSKTCRIHLSNPKPGHSTGGSGRSARRSGRAGSGKIGCKQNYSPRKQKSTVPSKASKKRRFNVSPEARTSEIPCKATAEQNQRLTTGLSAVYPRDEESALFLAAEQWNDAFLFCKPFSCKACAGIFGAEDMRIQPILQLSMFGPMIEEIPIFGLRLRIMGRASDGKERAELFFRRTNNFSFSTFSARRTKTSPIYRLLVRKHDRSTPILFFIFRGPGESFHQLYPEVLGLQNDLLPCT